MSSCHDVTGSGPGTAFTGAWGVDVWGEMYLVVGITVYRPYASSSPLPIIVVLHSMPERQNAPYLTNLYGQGLLRLIAVASVNNR